jgi:hypothetical protein
MVDYNTQNLGARVSRAKNRIGPRAGNMICSTRASLELCVSGDWEAEVVCIWEAVPPPHCPHLHYRVPSLKLVSPPVYYILHTLYMITIIMYNVCNIYTGGPPKLNDSAISFPVTTTRPLLHAPLQYENM